MGLALSFGDLKAQKVGDAAPDFSLQMLDGNTFTLSAQKGKVVFIFLFGNACPHCIANGPNTQVICETFMLKPDFVALGIDVWNGNASAVTSFRNITGITYPLALDGSELPAKYTTTYDRILIVDREGILHYKASSNATTDVTAVVAEQLEILLKNATGIDEINLSENALSIYPNPIRDVATVQTNYQPGFTT